MAKFRWKKPPSKAWDKQKWFKSLSLAIEQVLLSWSPRLESYAKLNATWTDRTANARQRLEAFVYREGDVRVFIVLKHNVDYGKWLEIANGGKYAIILPTLEHYYDDLMRDAKKVMK